MTSTSVASMNTAYWFLISVAGLYIFMCKKNRFQAAIIIRISAMNKTIKTKVTAQGVLIPRQLLEGIEEVEIKKENDVITIMPTGQMNSDGSRSQPDPIWNLGEKIQWNVVFQMLPNSMTNICIAHLHELKYILFGVARYIVISLPLKLLTTKTIHAQKIIGKILFVHARL